MKICRESEGELTFSFSLQIFWLKRFYPLESKTKPGKILRKALQRCLKIFRRRRFGGAYEKNKVFWRKPKNVFSSKFAKPCLKFLKGFEETNKDGFLEFSLNFVDSTIST